MTKNPGRAFRDALTKERPLQIVGTINAYVAKMAKRTGCKAIYLSGAGVANSSYGMPDLGMTSLDHVLEDASRITSAVDLPLLVDIDTGWGDGKMIEKTIRAMEKASVAAVHLEDQLFPKRCGHRAGKVVVAPEEMLARIQTAVGARKDPDFVVMARCDAFEEEGLEGCIQRCIAYREAGADMLFPEAFTELEHYRALKEAVGVPVLANITEFGKTPLFTVDELAGAGVDIVLYPLSANRAMNQAALTVLQEIRKNGSQKGVINIMQTREELYDYLDYQRYEEEIDLERRQNSHG